MRGVRRLAGLFVVAVSLAVPASASADSSIAVAKVSYTGYVPYVDVSAVADPPCAADTCRWYAAIRIASSPAGCEASRETPFTSGLERGGGPPRRYATRYPTSTGARSETACLIAYETDTETTRVLASATYEIPPQGGTWTPPGPSSPGAPGAGAPGASAPPAAKKAPSSTQGQSRQATFSRAAAGRKLNRALARRYGRRWTRARSRSVSCTARSIRTFRCTARFGGRTVRALVSRGRVRYIK